MMNNPTHPVPLILFIVAKASRVEQKRWQEMQAETFN